jgi:hypothetical protein
MLSRTNWVQSPGDEDVLVVADLETSSALCACADVLAVASISHSEAVNKDQVQDLERDDTTSVYNTERGFHSAVLQRHR